MPGKRQDSGAPTPTTENSTNEPKDGQDRQGLTTKYWRQATSVTFAQNGPNELSCPPGAPHPMKMESACVILGTVQPRV